MYYVKVLFHSAPNEIPLYPVWGTEKQF